MTQLHRIIVNGIEHRLSVPGAMPLLDVLRDRLGLRGSKFGCGEGTCGACTVLVDGKPRTACDIAIEAIDGAAITTIEGLSRGGNLHPVQLAFLELQAGQCGYCLSGIIMRAAALLESNPKPTRSDVATALDGHLCRCGAQDRILKAVGRAAELMTEGRP